MQIKADWITSQSSQRIMALLNSKGVGYFVGGCVRNALLDVPVSDLDISTDLVPEQVIALATDADLKVVPTGIDHGTVTVIIDKTPFEITTFRKDIATDGRRAVVAFSKDIKDDAMRRDFTMNALYADASGTILDPLGGLPDLNARYVRFIENADQRIAEDYLRILRYFRFHAWYGNADAGLDPEALAACANGLDGLGGLSKERITSEILKLLTAPDPSQSLNAMQHTGVLSAILPGADPVAIAPLIHLEDGIPADPIRRLAALGGDIGVLRLSNKQIKHLETIQKALNLYTTEAAYRFSKETALDAALVLHASLSNPLPATLQDDLIKGSEAKFPIKASDLSDEYSGFELGQKLRELEKAWIASGFRKTRTDLLD